MLFLVASQVLRACKVSTTPPKSKIIVTKVAPRSFLRRVCSRHDTGWVATDFEICYNCCLVRQKHTNELKHQTLPLMGATRLASGKYSAII